MHAEEKRAPAPRAAPSRYSSCVKLKRNCDKRESNSVTLLKPDAVATTKEHGRQLVSTVAIVHDTHLVSTVGQYYAGTSDALPNDVSPMPSFLLATVDWSAIKVQVLSRTAQPVIALESRPEVDPSAVLKAAPDYVDNQRGLGAAPAPLRRQSS
jgi:hypothetical protein